MDNIAFEEIVSILTLHERPDLISKFKEHIKINHESEHSLSDSEGSATSEEEYIVEIDEEGEFIVEVDEDGFYSLK